MRRRLVRDLRELVALAELARTLAPGAVPKTRKVKRAIGACACCGLHVIPGYECAFDLAHKHGYPASGPLRLPAPAPSTTTSCGRVRTSRASKDVADLGVPETSLTPRLGFDDCNNERLLAPLMRARARAARSLGRG